ncbi:MFS transporter [Streptomyces tropicalis]|uniref:MFS transporter n=1 Tax=Streptomyces tropicalis TaxID=3034234 RepID=A0ABT6A6I8_9ACTN|nr:MFS transporter [Streptomyces tropicalis]MDF3300265.1 MFS transporter [Streptomyces tropicalis]
MSGQTDDASERSAGYSGRERALIAAASLSMLLVQLDWFALNLMLPVIARDFGTTSTNLQWLVSGYMLSLGALMVIAGRLADQHGRRRLILVGLTVFAALSVFCGAAQNAAWLVAGRGVQGVGAAMIFPLAVAIAAAGFAGRRQARAVCTVLAFSAVGTALGPFVGGAFAEHVSWRAAFFLNVPLCAVAGALMLRYVPESRDDSARRGLDVPGALTVALGLVCVMLGVDQGHGWGWFSPATLTVIAGGLVLLCAFLLVERRAASPLMDLSLLRNVPFAVVTAAGSLSNVVYCLVAVFSALYLQQARGLSPLEAGLVFLALSCGAGGASYWSGRLAQRWRAEVLMALGMLVSGAALVGLTFAKALWLYSLVFVVVGVGVGLGWALTNVATQSYVPPRQSAIASGVVLTSLVLAGAVGVTLAATVLETASGSAATAASDAGAIDAVLRGAAALGLLGAAAPAILAATGRRTGRPAPVEPVAGERTAP